MKFLILALASAFCLSTANAASTRTVDAQQISNGAAILTVPTTTDTLVGRSTTDTLTNKTLTAPSITAPTGLVKGDVGLGNVDNTSDATKNSATATLTNKTLSGASNTFTNIPAATALTGVVGAANGGTGLASPGASGNILTSNGTSWVSGAAPSVAPSISGTSASPAAITAAGGISFAGGNYNNIAFIQGSGGAVTVTATPQVVAGTAVGQALVLVGGSASNTVTLADGSGLSLNGTWVGSNNSALTLVWDGSKWTEISRR